MTTPAYCPNCGAKASGPFCASCGADLAGQPARREQADMASGLMEIEQLRLKLIPFRIGGLVLGIALCWFVVGPLLGNLIYALVAGVVLAFCGIYAGNLVGLAVLRK